MSLKTSIAYIFRRHAFLIEALVASRDTVVLEVSESDDECSPTVVDFF